MSPASKSDYAPKALLSDPLAYNSSAYGYKEKYSAIDYNKARQISYSDPVIAAVIQTRTNQIASFAITQENRWKMGFRVGNRDKKRALSGAAKKKAQELERFIMHCGFDETFEDTPDYKKRDNFENFLRKITRDSLTFDACTFDIVPRRNGMPAYFRAIDGATIRMMPDKQDRNIIDPGHQNLVTPIWGLNDTNIRESNRPMYVQVLHGVPVAEFDEWELAYGVRNPRSDVLVNGYGFSEIEMALPIITAHLNADTHNRRYFSQNSAPKGILAFEGNVPPDQLDALRRQWHSQLSGVSNAWRTPILSTGKDAKLNWIQLNGSNRDMEWGKYIEYLIKSICGIYQIDPIEIGFDIAKNSSGGGGNSLGGQGEQVERMRYSKDKGLSPLLRFIATMINEYVVWRIEPELEFEFVGLNINSEKEQLDLDEKQVTTFKMLNELREEYDLPKIDLESIKSPGDMVMSQVFIQAFSALQGQGEMGGDQGMPGGMSGEQGATGGQDELPDYESMTDEELQAEIDKLSGSPKKEVSKSLKSEFIL